MRIARSLFDIVNEVLENEGQKHRVSAIDLKIGRLRAVIPDSLEFCFGVISRDTLLEGVKLRIEQIPATVSCRECSELSEIHEPVFLCKECNSSAVELIAGSELEVHSIEVND